MYRGFNLTAELPHNHHYYNIGLKEKEKYIRIIQDDISNYASIHGILNGDEMEAEWFPQVEADVFISHSHKDAQSAITFAGWLKSEFNLKPFVDSIIWSYSTELLKSLDNTFCHIKAGTYNYNKRNLTTAHIHIMLCSALGKMMNQCECLFFLNTPNSITPFDIVDKPETYSPWLYYEIGLSGLIRKSLLEHPNRNNWEITKAKTFSQLNESQKEILIKYKLDMEHLTKLNLSSLKSWYNVWHNSYPKGYPLDVLYSMY